MNDDSQFNNNQKIDVISTGSSKPGLKSHKLSIAIIIVLIIIVVGYVSYNFNFGGFKTTTTSILTGYISKPSPKPIIYTPLVQLISMSNPYENGYINGSTNQTAKNAQLLSRVCPDCRADRNGSTWVSLFMGLIDNGSNYSSLTAPLVNDTLMGMTEVAAIDSYKFLFENSSPIPHSIIAYNSNKSIAVYSSLPSNVQEMTSYKYINGVSTNTLEISSGIPNLIEGGFFSTYFPDRLSNGSDNATVNSFFYALSFMQDGFDLYTENTLEITVKPVILTAAYYNDTLLVDLDGVSPEPNSSTSVYVNGKKESYTQYYSFLLLKTKLNKGNNSLYVNYRGYNLSAELFANPNLLQSNIYSNLIDGNYTNTSYIGFSIPYHNLKISNISVQVLYINGSSKDITNLANETSITINDNITTHISSGEIQLNYFNTSNMIKVDGLTKYGPIQLINNFEGYISIT
jgi:hypothetical protein